MTWDASTPQLAQYAEPLLHVNNALVSQCKPTVPDARPLQPALAVARGRERHSGRRVAPELALDEACERVRRARQQRVRPAERVHLVPACTPQLLQRLNALGVPASFSRMATIRVSSEKEAAPDGVVVASPLHGEALLAGQPVARARRLAKVVPPPCRTPAVSHPPCHSAPKHAYASAERGQTCTEGGSASHALEATLCCCLAPVRLAVLCYHSRLRWTRGLTAHPPLACESPWRCAPRRAAAHQPCCAPCQRRPVGPPGFKRQPHRFTCTSQELLFSILQAVRRRAD